MMASNDSFFERLYAYSDGLLELRAFGRKKPPVVRFISPVDHQKREEFIRETNNDRDVYFAVATRKDSSSGKRGNVLCVPALWCDVDFKDTPKRKADKLIARFPYKPSCIVATGGGYHLYWRLKEPMWNDELDVVDDVLKRICAKVGGDPSSAEAARVLRVPGTANLKPEYKPTPTVEIIQDNDYEYDADVFLDVLPETNDVRIEKNDIKPLPKRQVIKIRKHMPACIQHIIEAAPRDMRRGRTFNRLVLQLVKYFSLVGDTLEDALEKCAVFLRKCESSAYPTPEKRTWHFEYIWRYVHSNQGQYQFHCSFILGMHFPMSAFSCSECVIKDSPDIKQTILEAAEKVDNKLVFPADVMGGVAGEFATTWAQYLEVPIQFLYMGYLAAMGSLFARKVSLATSLNIQPRMFVALVGESATDRKSTALKVIAGHFAETVVDFKLTWGINSAEGLQRVIKESSDSTCGLLYVIDELKAFVSKCSIEASVLLPAVTTLFENNQFHSNTKNKSIIIDNAYLSIIGASTRETYERIYTRGFIDIGFPNRVFIVIGTAAKRFPVPPVMSTADKYKLAEGTARLMRHVGDGVRLKMTSAAYKVYHDWYMALPVSMHARRIDGYAMRLMMLIAINDQKLAIDPSVVSRAIKLCDWELAVRQAYDPVDVDNKMAEMEERIRRFLKSRGPSKKRTLQIGVNAYRYGLWYFTTAVQNLMHNKEVKMRLIPGQKSRKTEVFSIIS